MIYTRRSSRPRGLGGQPSSALDPQEPETRVHLRGCRSAPSQHTSSEDSTWGHGRGLGRVPHRADDARERTVAKAPGVIRGGMRAPTASTRRWTLFVGPVAVLADELSEQTLEGCALRSAEVGHSAGDVVHVGIAHGRSQLEIGLRLSDS